jgi:hypothetical protein
VREQAQDEPQWFAFRTNVSLCGGAPPGKSLAWLVWCVAACGACVTVYGAFAWLIGFDAEPLVHGWGDLSRVLGSLPG